MALNLPSARALWQWLRRNRLRILMYHSVVEAPSDPWAVTPAQFAAQMAYLAEHQFRVVTLADAARLLAQNAPLYRTVVLTFDDGYRDFLTNALPILQRYAFPAMLFVVTGRLGQTALWSSADKTRSLLTEAEVRYVQAQSITLGSHTVTHADLTTLGAEQLDDELRSSYATLVRWGEVTPRLAYPGGRFTAREWQAARRVGYAGAVIVGGRWGNGPETNCWQWRREPMLSSDSLNWFAHRVNGYYEIYYLWARCLGRRTR
jgi:peptidoglycan/xylan/chitin deacetylase (PgdA/CDA1 family)